MKKRAMLFLLAVLALLLFAGCRTRTISNPDLADTVLQPQDTPMPPAESAEPPSPAPEPPPPETQPPASMETPPPSQPPLVEEHPAENADDQRPDQAGAASEHGSTQLNVQTAVGLTVTYDPNGGDGGAVRTVVTAGEPYGIQPDITRRGYAFSGWWTARNGGTQILPDTAVTQSADHTLYAHWQEKRTCTVTFDGNGGRVKSKEARLELSDGDAFGILPTPLYEGYTFDGWFTAEEDGAQITPEDIFHGNEDVTLYAHWIYDPLAFWSFTLRNKTQQVYMCQQVSVYFELEQDNTTRQSCSLITATGSLNIAANRTDPAVTDDWVQGKKPQVVLKCTGDLSNAAAVKADVQGRFPDQAVVVISQAALGGDTPSAIYAGLAFAKQFYPDWYTDVDLALAAQELGVTVGPIYF